MAEEESKRSYWKLFTGCSQGGLNGLDGWDRERKRFAAPGGFATWERNVPPHRQFFRGRIYHATYSRAHESCFLNVGPFGIICFGEWPAHEFVSTLARRGTRRIGQGRQRHSDIDAV